MFALRRAILGVIAAATGVGLSGCFVLIAAPVSAVMLKGQYPNGPIDSTEMTWTETEGDKEYDCSTSRRRPEDDYPPGTCRETVRSWMAAVEGTNLQTRMEERSKGRLECPVEQVRVRRAAFASWRLEGCDRAVDCQATDRESFACVAVLGRPFDGPAGPPPPPPAPPDVPAAPRIPLGSARRDWPGEGAAAPL